MVMTSLPWGVEGGVDQPAMYQDRWRDLFRATVGNGVANDATDDYLKVTAAGADTTVQVSAGEAIIEGVHFVSTATESLDVAAVGVAPTVAQTRVDLIVLQYDPVDQEVTLVVKPGTPAGSGAVPPALTRSRTGVWEHSIARITRTGNVSVTQSMVTEHRTYCGSMTYASATTDLPTDAYFAALAIRHNDILVRRYNSGVMAWKSLINPEWSNLSLASGYVQQGTRVPQYRVFAGFLELRGVIKRSSGASFPASTWLSIASVSSTLTAAIPDVWYPRIPCAMTNVISPGMLQLFKSGVIQLHAASAVSTQDEAFLDGCRFPLS